MSEGGASNGGEENEEQGAGDEHAMPDDVDALMAELFDLEEAEMPEVQEASAYDGKDEEPAVPGPAEEPMQVHPLFARAQPSATGLTLNDWLLYLGQ